MTERIGLLFRVTGNELKDHLLARAQFMEREYFKRLGAYQERLRSGKAGDSSLPTDPSLSWTQFAERVDVEATYWLTIGEMRDIYLLLP